MWKKISRIIIISLIVILFLGTAIFLYLKSAEKPVVYRTVTPFKTDIIKKTVATGSIVPKKEIAVKSRTSGIIKEIFVEPGNTVEEGELLASLTIIPML
jgi:HlyD family secretion protein